MIEPFIDIAASKQRLFLNNRALTEDTLSLEGAGIHDGDMVSVFKARPQPERAEQPPNEAAETMRLQALGDNRILEKLRESAPDLADAVNDRTRFGNLFNQLSQANEDRDAEKQRAYAKLNDDPFDVESQRKIEEIIREEAVQKNLNEALEEMPEGELYLLSTLAKSDSVCTSFWSRHHALHPCRSEWHACQSICRFGRSNDHHVSRLR